MSVKRIALSIFFLFTVLSLITAACAPQPPAATAPPEQATEPPPAEEPTAPPPEAERKVATFIFTQEFDNLNPLYTNMWFSTITQQIWNCWAWAFDDKNQPLPVLITEMPSVENGGISEDGSVITLKLRDDLVWSDGEPITADDFIFTYEMTIDPNNAVSSVSPYDLIEKMEAPDPQTVVMTFTEPYAAWLGTLWKGILPEHIVKPQYEAGGTLDAAEYNVNPTVGCGPFVFDEWESGSFARFVANENYWLGRPVLDEIFVRFVPDDASQVAALKAGDGDFGTFFAYENVPELEAAGIKIIAATSGYNEGWYIYMHPEKGHPAMQDVKVRQALAYAFDRFSLNEDLNLGLTVPAATMWDLTPYVDPSIQAYPYDPEKAKQLLDEAGWVDTNGDGVRDKDGVELVLAYGTTTREVRKDTQAVAQQQLAEVGIKVDLLNYESDLFFSGYAEGGPPLIGDLDISQFSTVTEFPDPDSFDFLCINIPTDENPSGTNYNGYCDPELDALFQKQATQVDYAERQQTFYQISKLIFDKAYWIGIWQDPDLYGISSKLQNVKISGATPFFNVMEWDLSQ